MLINFAFYIATSLPPANGHYLNKRGIVFAKAALGLALKSCAQ